MGKEDHLSVGPQVSRWVSHVDELAKHALAGYVASDGCSAIQEIWVSSTHLHWEGNMLPEKYPGL